MKKALKLSIMTLFHPIAGFHYIKRERERINYLAIPVIILLALIVQIVSVYGTHYPLNSVNLRDANIVFECAKILLPVVTWGIASYAITTIMDGATKFMEAMLATCYAIVPFIIITPLLTLLSRILEANQAGLYYGIYGAMLFWIVLMLFMALKEMNDYSLGRTILITFLSLCTMMLIWASVALIFSLSVQFLNFVKEVFVEARYLIL